MSQQLEFSNQREVHCECFELLFLTRKLSESGFPRFKDLLDSRDNPINQIILNYRLCRFRKKES